MHTSWDDFQLFLAVAESGSLTAAARKLGVAQPTASRRLLELETRLRVPLFARGKEGTTLTSFGERLLEPARRMAEWAGETERVAEGAETEPRGVVRITSAPGVAFEFLAPLAASLHRTMPAVSLEVRSTIQYLDLVRREADLALRMQRPTQRELVTVASVTFAVRAYAAREYVERLPKGCNASQIDWITWAPPFEHVSPNPELARMIPGFRPAFASDDFLIQIRAAVAGLGAIFLGDFRHRFAQDVGLIPLPLPLPVTKGSLHLVAARSALLVPRVRAVADQIAAELEWAAARDTKQTKRGRR